MTLVSDVCVPYQEAAQEDRCAPRIALNIPATLRPSGTHGFNAIVKDLSVAGFRVETVTSMRAGALCWLNLPGLAGQQAQVMWNNGHEVGCAFASLLHPSVVDRLLAAARR
jgi:PilZ domain